MEKKIAILTSTRPLREVTTEIGHTVETLSPQKCHELAEAYDLVIIGSRASDDFYERIKGVLTRKMLSKFRFYSRSFFERFRRRRGSPYGYNDIDEGWLEILQTNNISFVRKTRMLDGNYQYDKQHFRWMRLADFVRDDRVTIIAR